MTGISRNLVYAIGPGIIYAAAAVGVSHLVQSTRAGAGYGFSMAAVMAVIFIVKYPAMRFGADYAGITGKNLIDNYYRQGRWIVRIFTAVILVTMFFVLASLGLVTAGLFKALMHVTWPDVLIAGVLLITGGISLIYGHYRLLEAVSKVLVPIFSLSIITAVIILSIDMDWGGQSFMIPEMDPGTIIFIVILAGFMPTPLDGSVLQSLWTCAKAEEAGKRFSPELVRLDFNIGYFISFLLAFCFLLMGTAVLHEPGLSLPDSTGEFAAVVISLFTGAIGEWFYPVIGLAAFTVMLSTMITILDGYPRTMATVIIHMLGEKDAKPGFNSLLNIMIAVNCLGSITAMIFLMKSFQAFIDLTSALVFITGPMFAALNHRAILSPDIPDRYRPGRIMIIWSIAGIIVMTAVAVLYIYLIL